MMNATTGERSRSWLVRVGWNIRATLATLLRAPRRNLAWPSPARQLIGTAVAVAAVIATMALVDGIYLAHVRELPRPVVAFFRFVTDFGLSAWFLWPTGIALIALALLDRPGLSRMTRGAMAMLAVRLGFVFLAVALPGLFINAVKHIIGRARPFVVDHDVWAFRPFTWPAAYASMPSGHSTTAFSAAVAIGVLWPQGRPLLWVYAALVAASRLAIWAHHPSDVLAGAIIGSVGALMVRHWFAARGLGFAADRDGHIQTLPGPTLRSIKRVAVRAAAA